MTFILNQLTCWVCFLDQCLGGPKSADLDSRLSPKLGYLILSSFRPNCFDTYLFASNPQSLKFIVLSGHMDQVCAVKELPDGRIVSASLDQTLKVWNRSTGNCMLTLCGHTSGITCITVLPDGRIVSGSLDNSLKIWSGTTGDCSLTLTGHTRQITCVTSLTAGRIVSASEDKTLRVWNCGTGKCELFLTGRTTNDVISCITELAPGRLMLGGFHDGTCEIMTFDLS